MAERDTDTTKASLRDTSSKFTDGIGRVIRAGTEAATEASLSAVKVTSGVVTGMAQSVADNINAAVADGASALQRSVDIFFDRLDSSSTADTEPSPIVTGATSTKSETKKTVIS